MIKHLGVALIALLVLAGCSATKPEPKPQPKPYPEAMETACKTCFPEEEVAVQNLNECSMATKTVVYRSSCGLSCDYPVTVRTCTGCIKDCTPEGGKE